MFTDRVTVWPISAIMRVSATLMEGEAVSGQVRRHLARLGKLSMLLSPQISASCNCKHSDNPPESWICFDFPYIRRIETGHIDQSSCRIPISESDHDKGQHQYWGGTLLQWHQYQPNTNLYIHPLTESCWSFQNSLHRWKFCMIVILGQRTTSHCFRCKTPWPWSVRGILKE